MDYGNSASLPAYEDLLDCLDRLGEGNRELPFGRYDLAKGFALYGFDFTLAKTSMNAMALAKTGSLNLNLRL